MDAYFRRCTDAEYKEAVKVMKADNAVFLQKQSQTKATEDKATEDKAASSDGNPICIDADEGIWLDRNHAARDIELLKQLDLTHIVSCGIEEVLVYHGFYVSSSSYCDIDPMRSIKYLLGKLTSSVRDGCTKCKSCRGCKTLVTSPTSTDRSAAVVVAYLIIKKDVPIWDAIDMITTNGMTPFTKTSTLQALTLISYRKKKSQANA
jgi:hypothetical protein